MGDKRKRRKREPISEWVGMRDSLATGDLRQLWESIKTEFDRARPRWRLTGLRRRDSEREGWQA